MNPMLSKLSCKLVSYPGNDWVLYVTFKCVVFDKTSYLIKSLNYYLMALFMIEKARGKL